MMRYSGVRYCFMCHLILSNIGYRIQKSIIYVIYSQTFYLSRAYKKCKLYIIHTTSRSKHSGEVDLIMAPTKVLIFLVLQAVLVYCRPGDDFKFESRYLNDNELQRDQLQQMFKREQGTGKNLNDEKVEAIIVA